MSIKHILNNGKSLFLQNQYVFTQRFMMCTSVKKDTENPDAPIDIPNPFQKEKVQCILCKNQIVPDYKNVKLLSQFQSPYTGRIYGRHITGLCKKMQEKVEKEIIKSQSCGLMGYYNKSVDFLKDPKLFDPERPSRPHKY